MNEGSTDSTVISQLAELPSLRERVHHQLEGLIVNRSIPPGTRLVEADLARSLGVSRGPIREALQLLARDGFVDLRPRLGTFVHTPSASEADDFFDFRRLLETEAARLAAERRNSADVANLDQCLRMGELVLAAGGDPSTAEGTPRFHHLVAIASGSLMQRQTLGVLDRRSNWYLSPFSPSRRRTAWNEHARIAAAISAGDADTAVREMAAHIDGGRRAFQEAT